MTYESTSIFCPPDPTEPEFGRKIWHYGLRMLVIVAVFKFVELFFRVGPLKVIFFPFALAFAIYLIVFSS